MVANPEFLKEGAAVNDFMRPDRIIIGASRDDSRAILERLYEPFVRNRDKFVHMSERSAELAKYAANAMLAARISLVNELAGIADQVGADIEAVRRGIGRDPRIGTHFLYAGAGYGGACFPKDIKALIHTADSLGVATQMLQAVEAVNGRQKGVLVRKMQRHYGPESGRQDPSPVGLGLQAQHGRHARGAQPSGGRSAAGRRRQGASL